MSVIVMHVKGRNKLYQLPRLHLKYIIETDKLRKYFLSFSDVKLPATLHGSYGLPSIPPDVQPFAARHAHRPVVATHAIKHIVQRGNCAATTPAAHGRHGHPLAHSGIIPLHC